MSRPRAAKAAGLAYEKACGRALAPIGPTRGQWFSFEDSSGPGWCQTDFLLPLHEAKTILVVEVKLTWTLEGLEKLETFYLPIVAKALGARVAGLVLCKNLTAEAATAGLIAESWPAALSLALAGHLPSLAWRGAKGPALLGPQAPPVRARAA